MYRTFHNYTNLLPNILTSVFRFFCSSSFLIQFGASCTYDVDCEPWEGTSEQMQGQALIVFNHERRTVMWTQLRRGKCPFPGTSDLAQFLYTAVQAHSHTNSKKHYKN